MHRFVIAALLAIVGAGSLEAQNVPQNLYYRFNEGTGTTTSNSAVPSVGTPTMTLGAGNVWVAAGKINASMSFTGTSAMATGWVTNLATGSWTIEFWLKCNNGQFGYACGDNGAATWRMFTAGAAGVTGITMRGGGMSNVDIPGVLDSTWHHIAIVHDDPANTVTAYRDGLQVLQNINQNLTINGTGFYVGNYTGTAGSYVGDLDEFRFWSVARTGAEIQANFNVEVNNGPTLLVSTPNLNLGAAVEGTAGADMNYTVSGILLSGNTTLTAPAGVEISFAQAAGYASSLQVTQFPSFGPTTVYARISATAAGGPIIGNITHDSAGATTKDVAVTGNVVSLLASVATLNAGFTTIGVPSNPVSYDLTGDDLINATSITVPPGFEVASSAAGPWAPTLNIPTTPSYVQSVFVRLDGVAVGNYAGDVANTSAPATVLIPISGDVFPPDNINAQRMAPGTTLLVDNNVQGAGGNGIVLLDFTLSTINAAWDVTAMTFSASGTADEQAGLSFIALYEDSQVGGNAGVFDGPLVDTLAATGAGVGFSGPNGDYTANIATTTWPAMTTRRFFLVCKLAGQAVAGETLKAELTGVAATSVGNGFLTGVPTGHPADAFAINAAQATVNLSGPVVFQTVNNNDQGPAANGRVVLDMRIIPKNDAWTINSFTFTHTGTIDGQADVSFLGLYIDDGDGIWEGPGVDLLATPIAGVNFNAPNGIYAAGLTAGAGAFTVNQVKRFFLVARLAGSASTGETMRVSVTAISESAPTGGMMIGVPTGSTSALMIDQPTLTVNAGPGNPTIVTRERSPAGFAEMIGQVRLSASNAAFTVTGMTLHTAGNGDWLNHLDPATGMQVYRDNGNGSFDVSDVLVFSGAGATPSVACTFTTSQNIPMSTDIDLWVVLNVLAAAGASPYETFRASIESAADINSTTVGGTVKIGTLTPESGELRVVDFSVIEFTPTVDLFAGGGAVKIEGSGFALPVTVTIGGLACTGTPTVNAAGTLISGLEVPSGTGTGLIIVLTTNNLAPKQLTQTFRYSSVLPNPNTGGGSTASSPSCSAGLAGLPLALALPALAVVFRRRKK